MLYYLLMENTDLIKPYRLYSEKELGDSINELKIEVEKKKSDIIKLGSKIEFYEKEVNKLNSKEVHKYQDKRKVIASIMALCQSIEQRFNKDYYGYISELQKNDVNQKSLSQNQKNYYKNVFKFLARKVEFVRHVDSEYEVVSIDMINRQILTKDKKIIKLDDLGTGQSQSAYLKALLSSSDERKMIVLFDEIAMMDQKSLQPIYDKLNELYNDNKLLFAILVQKSDVSKVKSIVRG